MEIFEKVTYKNFIAKNRLVRSATWESLASPEGFLNDEIYKIYEELAQGGVGTIITGLTDVSPYNWSLVGNMRLCGDYLIPDYQKLTEIVHRYDCQIMPELNMNIYVRADRHIQEVDIDDLTEEDMKDISELYSEAAVRARKAGFDGVQLHLAYDWFLSRFLNPEYNHRADAYGGTAAGRVKLLENIIKMIQRKCPEFHISAKFSFFDNANGDFAMDECVEICKELERAGLDSIEVLGSHSTREKGTKYEACYLDIGKAVKKAVTIPVILTGNNHNLENMEQIFNEEGIDLFALSRPLIREPDLPKRWMKGEVQQAKCVSCGMCYTTHGKRCIFNLKK